MLGAHSDTLVLVHVIWATADRAATLGRDMDAWLGGFMAEACREIRCDLLAEGNSTDHVHVVLRQAPTIALAEVVRRLKGGSSHAWNLRGGLTPLRWQTGYWARSVEQESLGRLVAYVRDQRGRHAAAATTSAWEQHEGSLAVPR